MESINIKQFIFELPLYFEIKVSSDNIKKLTSLLEFSGDVAGYNPYKNVATTYRVYSDAFGKGSIHNCIGFVNFFATCKQFSNNIQVIGLLSENEVEIEGEGDTEIYYSLIKVGQYPSLADIQISQIKDYKKILDNEKMRELSMSIGLSAHGVGIGSFVYLRRIFEHLIEEAHIIAKEKPGWNEDEYAKNRHRVVERIELLEGFLPKSLVEHKSLYGILSKGIHELSEEECKLYYQVVKNGIEMILDEKLEEKAKAERKLKTSKAINELNQKLSK